MPVILAAGDLPLDFQRSYFGQIRRRISMSLQVSYPFQQTFQSFSYFEVFPRSVVPVMHSFSQVCVHTG